MVGERDGGDAGAGPPSAFLGRLAHLEVAVDVNSEN